MKEIIHLCMVMGFNIQYLQCSYYFRSLVTLCDFSLYLFVRHLFRRRRIVYGLGGKFVVDCRVQ